MTRSIQILLTGWLVAVFQAQPLLAQAQQTSQSQSQAPAANVETTEGRAVNSTKTTLIIRTPGTNGDEYRLFEMNSDTTRPTNIPPGASVKVESAPGVNPNVPVASAVQLTALPGAAQPPAAAAGASPGAAPAATADPQFVEPIPPSLQKLEKQIARQTSRYRIGGRVGMGFDQELVMVGAQGVIGPFFNENTYARPSLEFGFGELTTLVALNLEAGYRPKIGPASGAWFPYFGMGIGINFASRDLTADEALAAAALVDDGTVIDPDDLSTNDFNADVGLNLIGGVQTRQGLFVEMRASAYAQPTLRFVVGFNLF